MTTIFETLPQIAYQANLAQMQRMLAASPPSEPQDDVRVVERFEPFIAIDIRHGFHNGNNGVTPEIAVTPSARTLERLRLLGFLPYRRPGGLDLLWTAQTRHRANRAVAEMRKNGGDPALARLRSQLSDPLLFTVTVANPRFVTFTAMPTSFRMGDPPLLLSNHRTQPGDERTAALNLDWSRRVRVESIVDTGGMDGPDRASTPRASSALVGPVDPRRDELAALARTQPFAILQIFLTAANPVPTASGWDGLPVDLSGASECFEPVRYTLDLPARETCWRYLVAGRRTPLSPQSLSVVTQTGEDAGFVLDPTPRSLPDGRPAFCLASSMTRTLQARPDTLLSLVGSTADAPSRARTLVERLPSPGPDSLVPRQPIPGATALPAWSDIYVFV